MSMGDLILIILGAILAAQLGELVGLFIVDLLK